STDSVHRQPFRFGSLRTHGRRSATNLSAFETCNTTFDFLSELCNYAANVHVYPFFECDITSRIQAVNGITVFSVHPQAIPRKQLCEEIMRPETKPFQSV